MRTLLFLAAALSTFASVTYGQRLYFGVVGGTNLTSHFPITDITTPTDAFGNPASRFQYLSGPRSLIAGALVEGRLTERLSVEVNVLHRPMKSKVIFTEFLSDRANRVTTSQFTGVRAWQFPVMLKYTLPSLEFVGRFRPFLEAGPSFRTQEDVAGTEPSQIGMTAGAGAAFHLGRFRIAPTLRYTRWARESIYPRYATKPDQLEFLTSFSVETEPGSRRLAGRKIEIGGVLGLPITRGFQEPVTGGAVTERLRYLAGLTVQAYVAGNFSVEANAIYKPLRAGSRFENVQTPFSVLTWQFPVLGKYGWTRSRWTPFVEAGPSFRLSGNLNGYNPSRYGITMGGGVERRTHGVRLSPALRYTRWARDAYPYPFPPGVQWDYSRTNLHAVELVFGFSF